MKAASEINKICRIVIARSIIRQIFLFVYVYPKNKLLKLNRFDKFLERLLGFIRTSGNQAAAHTFILDSVNVLALLNIIIVMVVYVCLFIAFFKGVGDIAYLTFL